MKKYANIGKYRNQLKKSYASRWEETGDNTKVDEQMKNACVYVLKGITLE